MNLSQDMAHIPQGFGFLIQFTIASKLQRSTPDIMRYTARLAW